MALIMLLGSEHWHKFSRELSGVEIAGEQKLYPWRPAKDDLGFESRTLFQKPFEEISAFEQKAAVNRVLDKLDPSAVVVVGYNYPAMRAAAIWARQQKKACIMIAETTWFEKRRVWPLEVAKAVWCRRYYDYLCLPGRTQHSIFRAFAFSDEPHLAIWQCYRQRFLC